MIDFISKVSDNIAEAYSVSILNSNFYLCNVKQMNVAGQKQILQLK